MALGNERDIVAQVASTALDSPSIASSCESDRRTANLLPWGDCDEDQADLIVSPDPAESTDPIAVDPGDSGDGNVIGGPVDDDDGNSDDVSLIVSPDPAVVGSGSVGTPNDDELYGTADGDVMSSYAGDDTVYGKDGNDVIDSGDDDDWVSGGKGDDDIVAGNGDDTVYGNSGDDEIDGGAGDDWLSGGQGGDAIAGGDGDDEIHGNSGDDELNGGYGDDVLYGDSGNDELFGGQGDDEMYGGSGDDVFYAPYTDDFDTIDGGSGTDTIDFLWLAEGLTVDLSKNTAAIDGRDVASIKSIENVIGGVGDDMISGSKGDNAIDGGDGNDWIRGKEGADTLTGGAGEDIFFWHRKDVVDSDGNYLGLDMITDFDAGADTLDFSGLIKNARFDDISEVVSLSETDAGTVVSVHSGAANGMQDVALLEGVFGLDAQSLYADDVLVA